MPYGIEPPVPPSGIILDVGAIKGTACRACAITDDIPDTDNWFTVGLRETHSLLSDEEFTLAGKAAQLNYWDLNSQYCPTCGCKTDISPDVLAKLCPACGKLVFPKVTPAVLVLVEKDESILLVRAHNFIGPFYGLVAGFLEVGESFEDCARREIMEETGISIKNIRYFVDRGKKVSVIISDGLRYEIAAELLALIRQEDRYEAELSPALSVLPSYTQLGMAALLPNKELSLAENETGTVFVDGMSSQGTANRIKILQSTHAQSTAITAGDLIGLNKDDARALVRDHDVVYIYQNRIDKTGHTRDTEERAFDAAEEAIQELIRMVKKLTGANASNLIITADHGFIYQHRHLENSDFSGKDASAETILFKDRRFVLGRNFDETPGLKTFSSQDLGLTGNIEVQIPKSINRLRQQGTGSRYVHGGASLQEVIIPILKINKKRQSDIEYVDVEIFRGASLLITSGQLAVTVYQVQPVTEKIQSRSLRLALFSLTTGEMISDSHELVFDYTSVNSPTRT